MIVRSSCATPVVDPPRVSIIIPTLGNQLLEQCLDALRQNISDAVTYEVVVVANGASISHLIEPSSWPTLRLITSLVNLGFGGACNRGAAEAVGEFLVFLNDDTEVLPGWLEALVATADDHPEAGAVGS